MQWQNVDLRFLFLVPETSGVYVFTVGNQVVYVGQATNLQERIKQHFSDSETNSDLKAVIQHYRISVLYQPNCSTTVLAKNTKKRGHLSPFDIIWCRKQESDLRPLHYECTALPTELFRQAGAV